MPKQRGFLPFVFYIFILLISVAALWGTLYFGESLTPSTLRPTTEGAMTLRGAFADFQTSVSHHADSTIGVLLLQILIILIAARAMGWLFRKVHQPAVIGEIVAGILLGPSLFGRVAPETFDALFPASSLSNVQLLSNFGLILFMFAVGMELRLGDIRKQLRSSIIISHTGIFIPFVLSLPLSYTIYSDYAAGLTDFTPFALFIGIAMSITAFPVLARIIQENNLQRTHLGKLSLSTAAAGDITAWLMLAAIIAIAQSGSLMSTGYNLLFLIVYLLVIFGIIRPLFRAAGKVYNNTEVISHGMVGTIFILLLLSSYITELLSMHALFGAFMLGLVMPEDLSFRKIVTDKIEDVSLMLFLPLFFVSSGLQTELGLIDSPERWALLGVFTLIAVVGKVGGTYISARASGESPRNSIFLGAFMNTRGLMELVVLGIANREEFLRDGIKLHKRSPGDGMGTVMQETNKHVVGLDIGDRAVQDRVDNRSDIGNSCELADLLLHEIGMGRVELSLEFIHTTQDSIQPGRETIVWGILPTHLGDKFIFLIHLLPIVLLHLLVLLEGVIYNPSGSDTKYPHQSPLSNNLTKNVLHNLFLLI